LYEAIRQNQSVNIRQISNNRAEQVGNNQDVGFYIHPTLVLDALSGFPLGLSAVQLWTREKDHADKKERNYQNLDIEEKESYKWIASAQKSRRCFEEGGAKIVTHIGDRESDIFEEFATVANDNNHLLVRACQNRRLARKVGISF
jgi:hypothetical protein